ncbi:hypothetical protein J3R30DRAFT_1396975 [Lentinula aciculospora]|uniref:Uncharacterized protein n=1 Tax=Lentinula aciculospora TaxID=153920 RepID=A0A9W9DV64_9AGAR|nr:hypothetical protein J3R30DRAFT_1396975 [Lentinula aciculospora]
MIVGAVLGSIIGITLAIVFFLLVRRKRRRSKPPSSLPGLETFRFDHKKGVRLTDSQNTISATSPNPLSSQPVLPLPVHTQGTVESSSSTASEAQQASASNTTSSENNPETPSEPIRRMEQRIFMLEQMLRQADQVELALHDTSPPPY